MPLWPREDESTIDDASAKSAIAACASGHSGDAGAVAGGDAARGAPPRRRLSGVRRRLERDATRRSGLLHLYLYTCGDRHARRAAARGSGLYT